MITARTLTILVALNLNAMGLFRSTMAHSAQPGPAGADNKWIESYVSRLSLEAKVGQMIQAEILNIKTAMGTNQHPVRDLGLGSVLAGGDSMIQPNTQDAWLQELENLQDEARSTPGAVPLLIGVDAVHGHALVRGATVFPHNIGLGATRDPELLQKIGAAVAREVLATGFNWTFAPAVSVARDLRWGRTYESFGEHPELQRLLVQPYIRGLQETPLGPWRLAATAKHFLGDGGTLWGTGYPLPGEFGMDRGDTRGALKDILAMHGLGFQEAIKANVDTIMVSYNSVNGIPMHAERSLIMDYLKKPASQGGLGFEGLVVSDWNAIDELRTPGITDPLKRYQNQLIQAVQAGVDMVMVHDQLWLNSKQKDSQFRYARAHQLLVEAVQDGRLPRQRIDDAVARIIKVKVRAGLLDQSPDQEPLGLVDKKFFGHSNHRELAREAVRKSLVLLKNEAQTLPITAAKYKTLCVAGSKADNFGIQAGAWTTGWQGTLDNASKTPGSKTILDGLRDQAREKGLSLIHASDGKFSDAACSSKSSLRLVVVGEKPYAEFQGDRRNLSLPQEDLALLHRVRSIEGPMVVVLLSGRPLVITKELPQWQALVAAWLPGSQGEGVADVLFGDYSFTGKLSQTWPASMDQLPFGDRNKGLFRYGFGLRSE
ncbi:MAG TPA: glycoside hydrolase family 3 protein [Oligoflexus sp.]|uniref:glycoside hydrolase family 3 protein n=1 Tax=Oligoflexus sp. TaxID=1971216 RepID=UPI002D5D2D2F|nr:glycoside hydrolase family 3 protein [Oligoflexus sp.]HYX37563.1 glycoside hydrolase family 3 protein [Oligoflexus sp.]